MDILYGHLENYQDENVISELKNENQELKCKLEEYASNLARLQNDFDNLSAEYKKLESNYSSLLKTARAEIERKSQLITNLNLEKDKLVLGSIQNRGWTHKKKFYNGGNQKTGNQSGKEGESAKQQQEPAATNSFDKNITRNSPTLPQFNNEKKDKQDKKPSLNPNPKSEIDAKDYNKDADLNKKNITKSNEDHADNSIKTKGAVKVSKIKDRRKSMPVPNREDYKFSSDEDLNDNLRDHRFRRKTPLRETIDRKHQETNHNGRHYHERKFPSEIPPVGDRRGYDYDYSRDVYRKSNWHRHNDRQRSRENRDMYETSQRSRRCHSPDRPQINKHYEYYNKHREPMETPHWSDRNRYRVLESPPPPDKYTQNSRSRDSDRIRFDRIHNPEAYPMKHKIHNVVEEPPTKRPRSESFNKQPDKHINFHQDKDVCTVAAISKPLEFSYLSLQSPDHVHFENPPVHHIKEILSTANTKLDDPRLTSKKYVVSTYKDKVMLSTVGKDVDIKVIDTTKWDIDKNKEIHKLPSPLREKPPINEDFMKDIYVGIDHPLSNISLESGEICLEDDEIDIWSYNKNRITEENSNNKKVNNNNLPNQSQAQVKEYKIEATATVPNTMQTSSTHLSKSYKIPKVNKQSTAKPLEDKVSRMTYDKPSNKDVPKESYKKKSNRDRRDSDKKIQSEVQEPHYNPLKMFSDAIGVCKNKSYKFVDISQRKYSSEKALASARDTVEGDLELSDETCDYTEATDEIRHDKEKIVQIEESNKNSIFGSINRELSNPKLEKKDSAEINVFKHGIEKPENKHFDIQEKESKRKESKEKNKPRKDDKPKDIKSKLCDLFGETSSLITPEDLGIVSSSTTATTKENINEYTPLYDNTQDAVDLNIEEMEKVQTRSIKLKTDETFAKDVQHDVTSDKKEKNIVKKTKKDEKQTSKNSIITSPVHQMFQNINTEQAKEDDETVKTVIISTGIQNNPSSGTVHETQEKQLTNIQRTDNASKCPILNLTALATSTPHKGAQLEPSLSITETSCNSSKSMTKEASDIASGDRKRNLGEPDLRIIVKRRRKHKGKTS